MAPWNRVQVAKQHFTLGYLIIRDNPHIPTLHNTEVQFHYKCPLILRKSCPVCLFWHHVCQITHGLYGLWISKKLASLFCIDVHNFCTGLTPSAVFWMEVSGEPGWALVFQCMYKEGGAGVLHPDILWCGGTQEPLKGLLCKPRPYPRPYAPQKESLIGFFVVLVCFLCCFCCLWWGRTKKKQTPTTNNTSDNNA